MFVLSLFLSIVWSTKLNIRKMLQLTNDEQCKQTLKVLCVVDVGNSNNKIVTIIF